MQNPSPIGIGAFREWPDHHWDQAFCAVSFEIRFPSERELEMRFGDKYLIRYIVGEKLVTIITIAGTFPISSEFELPLVVQMEGQLPEPDPLEHMAAVRAHLAKHQTHKHEPVQVDPVAASQILIRRDKLTLQAILPHLTGDVQFWIYDEKIRRDMQSLVVYRYVDGFWIEVFRHLFVNWGGFAEAIQAIRL